MRNAKKIQSRHQVHVIEAGTAELKNHNKVEIQPREYYPNGAVKLSGGRVQDQLPIDRYFQRGQLDPADKDKNYLMYQSAERLMNDFYYAGLSRYAAPKLEQRVSSGGRDKGVNLQVQCLENYKAAMAKISPVLRPIIVSVVCLGESAQAWACANAQASEAGIVVLRLALLELAHHYGWIKMPLDMCPEHKLIRKP